MPYRDDLEAAHARIEALEAQLAEVAVDVEDTPELQRRIAALESRIGQVQRQAATVIARFDHLAGGLAGSGREMVTLTEFNRTIAPDADALSGRGADVACPLCKIFAGELVEMLLDNNVRLGIVNGDSFGTDNSERCVRCPRCTYLGVLAY
jgi:hypothetical protein